MSWMIEASRQAEERAARLRRVLALLHKWGIHSLGEFAALERAQVTARLGPEAAVLWERATGRSTRILKLVTPPESFQESFEFEHDVETIEPLLFILRRFLEQLGLRLNNIYLVARELTLRITFTNKQTYTRGFKIPQPTNSVELLFRMLQAHLEDFKSEHPIAEVALEAGPARPAQQQFGLFETALRDPNQLCETLARLTGLLGANRVGTPVIEETHRPDSFRMEPFAWQLDDEKPIPGEKAARCLDSPAEGVVSFASAALRRFRPAQRASVLVRSAIPARNASQSDAGGRNPQSEIHRECSLAHITSPDVNGTVTTQSGPYAASGHWWDGKKWSRREWDLQLSDGAVLRCHESPAGWGVDGIYD